MSGFERRQDDSHRRHVRRRLALALAVGILAALMLATGARRRPPTSRPAYQRAPTRAVGPGQHGQAGQARVTSSRHRLGRGPRRHGRGSPSRSTSSASSSTAEGDERVGGRQPPSRWRCRSAASAVDAAGTVTLVNEDGRWTLTGGGEGTAGEYEGTGGLVGTRVPTGSSPARWASRSATWSRT